MGCFSNWTFRTVPSIHDPVGKKMAKLQVCLFTRVYNILVCKMRFTLYHELEIKCVCFTLVLSYLCNQTPTSLVVLCWKELCFVLNFALHGFKVGPLVSSYLNKNSFCSSAMIHPSIKYEKYPFFHHYSFSLCLFNT